MLGHSHALSGAAAGLAAATLVLHDPAGPAALLTALTAAYALAPDLDSCGSTAARSLGFATRCVSRVIRAVSGGHRHGTHSLLGIAVFAAVAGLACSLRGDPAGRILLWFVLAAGLTAASDALRMGHIGNLLALGAAAVMAVGGFGLALVPVAAALGCATHIAGDMLTVSGCPLLWPGTLRDFHLLPRRARFSTGHAAEKFLVTPLLLAALGVLAWHALRGGYPS